jgi:hypothetical protein
MFGGESGSDHKPSSKVPAFDRWPGLVLFCMRIVILRCWPLCVKSGSRHRLIPDWNSDNV